MPIEFKVALCFLVVMVFMIAWGVSLIARDQNIAAGRIFIATIWVIVISVIGGVLYLSNASPKYKAAQERQLAREQGAYVGTGR